MARMMHSWSHVSSRTLKYLCGCLFFATCCFPAFAFSKVLSSRFLLPGVSAKNIKVYNTRNDFTFLVVSRKGTVKQISALREHFDKYSMVMASFQRIPQGGWEGMITFNQKIKSVNVSAHKGGTFLNVKAQDEEEFIFSHLDEPPPRTVPSRYTGKQFRNAERQLEQGNMRRATQMFIELGQDYALRSWASLRLADLDLMLDNKNEACRSYGHLIDNDSHRVAGVLASLRSLIVGCEQKKILDLDWEKIVNRISFADGPISDYLWGEYLWIADLLARDYNSCLHFLGLEDLKEKDPRVRLLPDALRQKLFSRAIYMAKTTFDIVRVYYRYPQSLKSHPDKNGLQLEIARALLDLDLLEEADERLQPILRDSGRDSALGWGERNGLAQAMVLKAWTYRALGQPVMMEEMAKIYRQRFKRGLALPKDEKITLSAFVFEEELKLLRQGISALRKKVRNEGRKSTSLIPKYDAAKEKALTERGER